MNKLVITYLSFIRLSTGNELRKRLNELSQNLHKEIEIIKKKQSEIKNTLDGINSRLDEANDQTSNLEVKVVENTQLKQQKEKFFFFK